MTDPAVEQAQPAQWEPALRLLLRHLPLDVAQRQAAETTTILRSGAFDPTGLLVLQEGQRLTGAIAFELLPGATALVWPPAVLCGPGQAAAEDLLLQEATRRLRQRGAKVGQVYLSQQDEQLAGSLPRNGFADLTRLWYLRHDGTFPGHHLTQPERLVFLPYRSPWVETFHQLLLRSHEGTLDCPELNGMRTADEIVAGLKAEGDFTPELWWLLQWQGKAVGVLVVSRIEEGTVWDLAFVGLVPECRGQGLGREAVLKVLWEARAAEVSEVRLTVDQRNTIAWGLYRQLGFEAYAQRRVYLALWP